VDAVVQAFKDPKVALVGGNNRPAFAQTPPPWLAMWWAKPVAHGRALAPLSILDFGLRRFEIDPGWVWGCNFSIRRQALEAARGFHPDALPKDRLRFRGDGEMHVGRVVRESGASCVFEPGASVRHLVDVDRMTQAYFEQRAFAQGVSDSYASIRYRRRPVRDWTGWIPSSWRDWWSTRHATGPVGIEWRRVLAAARRSHGEGVAFHREAVRRDPGLLTWVLKDDYR
jgi:hypothetical protein